MRVVRRGSWWNFNLVVAGRAAARVLAPGARPGGRGHQQGAVLRAGLHAAPRSRPSCRTCSAPPRSWRRRRRSRPTSSLLEALIPLVYRRSRFLAISESTRDDLVRARHRRGAGRGRALRHGPRDLPPRPDGGQERRADHRLPRPAAPLQGRGLGDARAAARARAGARRAPGRGRRRAVPRRARARRARGWACARRSSSAASCRAAEKVRALQRAWALVQPSPKEGWGLTVVEAGACGTAVVAADSPGLRDSVRRDETGLLVPYGDDAAPGRRAVARARRRRAARTARGRRAGVGGALHLARLRRRSCDALSGGGEGA